MIQFTTPKQILGLGLLLAVFSSTQAQQQIPSGDFENWTTPPGAQYQEPTGGWWTTLNALRSLTAPVTVEKSTDAHSGTYSAKLTTATWGTLLLPGLLVSGVFDIQNPRFLLQGQPFTDRPDAFQGWYKYVPVNGDSAGIAALLTHWNAGANRRDTLATAAVVVTGTQSSWTSFDLPFIYLQSGTPDSIIVALVASGDGQNFNGQAGSTLWIDDLSFEYITARPEETAMQLRPQISIAGNEMRVRVPMTIGACQLKMYDAQGRVLCTSALHAGDNLLQTTVPDGVYLVEISKSNQTIHRQKLLRIHR